MVDLGQRGESNFTFFIGIKNPPNPATAGNKKSYKNKFVKPVKKEPRKKTNKIFFLGYCVNSP